MWLTTAPSTQTRFQEDDDFDGLGNACDTTFDAGSAATYLDHESSVIVQAITAAAPPGANGMISKLIGKGGVAQRVANAVSSFENGFIDVDTYVSALDAALDKLTAFDNQLAAKIANGQITDPEETELQDSSAVIRSTINNLISAAGA